MVLDWTAVDDNLIDPAEPLFDISSGGLEPSLWETLPALDADRQEVISDPLDLAKGDNSAGTNILVAMDKLSAAGSDEADQVPRQQLECIDKHQIKLSKSRLSQRKSRERQKARSVSLQTQLVTTSTEVEGLRAQLQQSQARTLLLETVASLTRQGRPEQPAEVFWDKLKKGRVPEMHSEAGPSVPVTIFGPVYMMPISEITNLTQPQFSKIVLDYMRPLASALLDLDGCAHPDPAAVDALQKLAVESGEFYCALVNFNVRAATVLYTGQLLGDSIGPSSMSCSQYSLLVKLMNLSEAQVKDLLELRQLHIARRDQLATERKALTRQMSEPTDAAWHVRENVSRVATLSEALKENAAKDYQIDAEVQCAVLRGILNIHQFAVLLVHAFPFVPATRELLDAVATRHIEQAPYSASPAQTSLVAAMQKLDCYLKAFKADCQIRYVPYQVTSSPGSTDLSTRQRFLSVINKP